MSTQYTDLDKGQEASRGTAGTIYNEDTIHLEQAPPPVNVPRNLPEKPPHSKRNFRFTIAAVVIILGLIFQRLRCLHITTREAARHPDYDDGNGSEYYQYNDTWKRYYTGSCARCDEWAAERSIRC